MLKRVVASYWRTVAAIGFAIALSTGAYAAPAPGLKERLIGTWRLIAADSRNGAQDSWGPDYGPDPKGYFVYDSTGHFALQFCASDSKPIFASGNDFTPTPDEAKAVYLNYVAYFGTFKVDEKLRVLTHHVEGSLIPSYIGTDQLRPFHLDGDRLEIGDGSTWRRVLERVKSAPGLQSPP
jgi:Lipocalin-like domain